MTGRMLVLLHVCMIVCIVLGKSTTKHKDKETPKDEVIRTERKHLKVVLLGEDIAISCQGGSGRQDGIWSVTASDLGRWTINQDNAVVIKEVSLSESGIYNCTSRRSYHLTLLYVVYAPSGLFLVDPLPYKLQERCSPNLMSELNTFIGVAVCTKSALDKQGACSLQVTGECMPLEPPRGGYHWRYLLYLMRAVPRLKGRSLHRLLDACESPECVGKLGKKMIRRPKSLGKLLKASHGTALVAEEQWRVNHDYLGLFVRDGKKWLKRETKARCPVGGSYLRGTMCVPCEPNTHMPQGDEHALAPTKCEPCPKNYEQPYYGATDCTHKPKLVSKLSTHGVFVEGTLKDDGFGNIATMNVSTALILLRKKFYSLSLPALVTAMIGSIFFLGLLITMCVLVCRQGVGTEEGGEEGGKKKGGMFMLRLPSLPASPVASRAGSGESLLREHRHHKRKRKKKKKRKRSVDDLDGEMQNLEVRE